MGNQCIQCTNRVQKQAQVYQLVDQLYDVNEGQIIREVLTTRKLSFEPLRNAINNEVNYLFVKPEFHVVNIQQIINYVLNELLSYMQGTTVKLTDYTAIKSLKETQRQRYVIIHLVQRIQDIEQLETHLFDVFVCLNPVTVEQAGTLKKYIYEQCGNLSVFTKTPQYQLLENRDPQNNAQLPTEVSSIANKV